MSHVLTINAGSSSVKFGLFELAEEPLRIASGQVDRVGGAGHLKAKSAGGETLCDRPIAGATVDHAMAVDAILELLNQTLPGRQISVVGHRVVHGGLMYATPVLLDDPTIAELHRLIPLAPLHQPHNLAGVQATRAAFPGAPQVACFDTAFHRDHPWVNDVFALPREYYDKGVRRYGFHGLSYEFISGELATFAPRIRDGRVLVAHLGNGASMCAMIGGRSVASTMGFSALDGLPMGTRCGQLDPGVVLYLMKQEGLDADGIAELLNKKSGLLGLSGLTSDMRTLEASDAPEAAEAIDYFVFRIRRELGALTAVMGGLDALVFTGGIGENSRVIRARVCDRLDWFGIELDHGRNARNERLISRDFSRARVMVVPTNEELVIARAAAERVSTRFEAAS